MNEAQRGLRRQLRAQARQLGDGESLFKPVSYEIKHLAEKTSLSVKEIGGLIATVREETSSSVTKSADGLKAVDAGLKLVRGVESALTTPHVDVVADLVGDHRDREVGQAGGVATEVGEPGQVDEHLHVRAHAPRLVDHPEADPGIGGVERREEAQAFLAGHGSDPAQPS